MKGLFLLVGLAATLAFTPVHAASFGSSGAYSSHAQTSLNLAWQSGKRQLWTHLRSHLQKAVHYATLAYQNSPPSTQTRIYAQRALNNARAAESQTVDVLRRNSWWASPIDHYMTQTGANSARSSREALRRR